LAGQFCQGIEPRVNAGPHAGTLPMAGVMRAQQSPRPKPRLGATRCFIETARAGAALGTECKTKVPLI
jgi:hypothetical protein